MAGISGQEGEVRITNQSLVNAFDNETMITTDRQTYRINDESKSFFFFPSGKDYYLTPTIRRNGVIVLEHEYTVFYAAGAITFREQQSAGDVITIKGWYVETARAATANSWNLDIQQEIDDVTSFVSEYYHEYLSTLKNATAKIDALWESAFYAEEVMGEGKTNMLACDFALTRGTALHPNPSGFRFYAILTGDNISTGSTALARESLSLQTVGPIHFYH